MNPAYTASIPSDSDRPSVVLIVEDDNTMRGMMGKLVERLGCQTIYAENGKSALSVYAQHLPDLVLLDVMMPDLDGFETCRRLVSTYGDECAPILIVTARDDRTAIQQALDAGAFDYITKPYQVPVLKNRILRLLEIRRAQQAIQQRGIILETLNQLAGTASSRLSFTEMLNNFLGIIGPTLKVTSARISEIDPKRGTSSVIAQYFSPHAQPAERQSPLKASYSLKHDLPSVAQWLTQPQVHTLLHHDEPSAYGDYQAHLRAHEVQTALVIILNPHSNFIGKLELWESRHKREFSAFELHLLNAICAQISSILDNALLYAELEARNRELDGYSHMVAHDLKSPLNLAVNFTSFALQSLPSNTPSEVYDYLGRVVGVSQRMAKMIDSLLQLARLGDEVIPPERVDVQQAAKQALSRYDDMILAHKVTISLAPDLPPCLGYAPWLEEIFANLIGNALKYMDEEKPRHTLSISADQAGDLCRYSVTDNGIGIATEDQTRMFERFTRLNNQVDGFGLGLSLVKRMVERLGGQVGVESEFRKGSTFWFALPPTDEG